MSFNFNIASSGMYAAQRGLKVAQQNIANMNTEGYARQVLELKENGAATGSGKDQVIGSGVKIENIKMITDKILNSNYNNQNSNVHYYTGLDEVLTEIETVFGENTSGDIGKVMESFFEAWEELSKFPEESSYRLGLLGESNKLTQKINTMANELGRIEEDTLTKAERQVAQVNTVLSGLAEINKKINAAGSDVPNALLMERDRMLQEVSSYIKIDVSYESSNPHLVTVRSSGSYLVDKEQYYGISLVRTDRELYLTNGQSKIDISSGEIKASLDSVNIYVNGYENQLNNYVQELKKQINDIHVGGYSLLGDTGLDYFTGNNSKDFRVNALLMDSPNKIATSSVFNVEGNTEIAKNIAKVIEKDIVPGTNFRNYISGFNMGIAQDINTVKTQVVIQEELLSGISEQKENLQGVNLEEEMLNLMMFQKSYQANAKAINIGKEVFDALFQII